MKGPIRTLVAASVSLALHGGAVAALLAGREEAVEIAGGATAVALVGDATVDAVAAGSDMPVAEPVDPTQTTPETVRPVSQAIQPAEPVPAHAVPAPAAPVRAVPVDTPPVPVATAAPASPVQAAESAVDAEIQATETIAQLEEIPLPSARPAEPARAEEPVRTAALAPQPQIERHEPLRPRVTEPAPEKPRREQARPEPTRKKQAAGNGGQNRANARKGTAAGRTEGLQAEAGDRSGNSRSEGNAAASNYPGKVVSKLRRALRYPAEAKRQKIRGEVHVAFTVGAGGGVSGLRVVRSSGSPVLDRAAMETVQRAAPFPPIPGGRASWPFTVPLAFSR